MRASPAEARVSPLTQHTQRGSSLARFSFCRPTGLIVANGVTAYLTELASQGLVRWVGWMRGAQQPSKGVPTTVTGSVRASDGA